MTVKGRLYLDFLFKPAESKGLSLVEHCVSGNNKQVYAYKTDMDYY